jgi:Leucine-rich repeat (LRR) protein
MSILTRIRTLKLMDNLFKSPKSRVDVDELKLLQNQLQTCLISRIHIKPELNEEMHPIYTLTNLKYLGMIGCEVSQLHDNISKLRSLQTLLLDHNSELCTLPTSISKLTSLIHLSLRNTKIRSDTIVSVVFNLRSLEELELEGTRHFTSIPSQISQLTPLRYLSLSQSGITTLPTEIGLLTRLCTLKLKLSKHILCM